jgi:hypothetical protein
MSTARNDTLIPTPTDGPGFMGSLLWATVVILVCTVAVGAAFQGSSVSAPAASGDVVAAH